MASLLQPFLDLLAIYLATALGLEADDIFRKTVGDGRLEHSKARKERVLLSCLLLCSAQVNMMEKFECMVFEIV